MKAKAGDRVKVITKEKTFEGILMPNEETKAVVVKLDNGYNIGIDNKKKKKIEIIKKYKKTEKVKERVKINKNKPTISILYTGGTIASKVDYSTGGVIASFTIEDLLERFPESFRNHIS